MIPFEHFDADAGPDGFDDGFNDDGHAPLADHADAADGFDHPVDDGATAASIADFAQARHELIGHEHASDAPVSVVAPPDGDPGNVPDIAVAPAEPGHAPAADPAAADPVAADPAAAGHAAGDPAAADPGAGQGAPADPAAPLTKEQAQQQLDQANDAAETGQLLSNIASVRHGTMMSIIGNIR